MDTVASVTAGEIRGALEALGVGRGSAIVVHGSLKRFGHVAGGAAVVVEAVMDAVGPEGLVTMPVYASGTDARGDLLREPAAEAPVTTGLIPATFGRHPRVVFAPHPLYAYAYYGRDAGALAAHCRWLLLPYGADQPLACLFARHGLIVQLGVDDVTNTAIHVAEELADPPYLAEKKSAGAVTVEEFFALPVEDRREILARHRAGPRRDFAKATPLILQAGLRRAMTVGSATVAVTDFTGMCALLADSIRQHPGLLLRD